MLLAPMFSVEIRALSEPAMAQSQDEVNTSAPQRMQQLLQADAEALATYALTTLT